MKTIDRYRERYATTATMDGIKMTLIGHWVDLAAYYEGSDGNAWGFNGRWTNCGDVKSFKERLAAGKVRGVLHETIQTYEQSSTSPRPTGGRQAEKLQQSGT